MHLQNKNKASEAWMILLQQFKHEPPCWEANVKGDPPTNHMEIYMTQATTF